MKGRRLTTARGFLTALLGVLLLSASLFPRPALAVTPAGTAINCVTQVSCTLPRNVFKFGSNPVVVTVLQVHGVAIDGPATVEAKPGKTVSLPHVITNAGNVPDTFALEAESRPEVVVKLYAGDGVTPLTDTDGDGRIDTSVIPGGSRRGIVVKLTAPATVKPGDVETVTLRATSTGGGADVTAAVSDTAKVADFWPPLVKAVSPAGQTTQGTLLTYTCSFGSDVSIPATRVLISDPLDKNLEFLEGSATLPPGIPGASVSFDPGARTVSWRIPSIPGGYAGSVSFKARVGFGTVSDTDIYNTFHVVSDQNPEPQFSKAMKTPVVEQPLRVIKTAGRPEAEIGDFVSYTVSVENLSKGLSAHGVEVVDVLPKGFRYAKGSSALDNVPLPDPSPATGVRWSIGTLEPGKRKVLTYRTLVSVDAPRGDGVNYATAVGKSPAGNNLVSPSAAAMVRVVEGVLNDKSIILGRVFVDLNRDLMPDREEPGMGGVRLYLDNGYYAVTDTEGKFSIVGIDAGDHVLKLDRTTLPPGFEPVALDGTFAGDGGSRFVRVPFGGPARGDFALRQVQPEAPQKPKQGAAPQAQEKVYTFDTSGGGPPALEEQIATMPDSPEILEPAGGALLRHPWTDIVVRSPEGAESSVSVNGNVVHEKQIGKTITESRRKIRITQYVGVKLDPGTNRIALEVTDPDGVAHLKEIEVVVPGEAVRLEVRSGRSDVPADGKSAVPFTVRFLDREGREAGGEIVYTVRAGITEVVEPDLDPGKPGHQLKAVDGRGTFHLRSGLRTGAERVEVAAGSNLKGSAEVFLTPQMREWVVAGVGSVTAAANSVSGKTRNVTNDDSFESGLDLDGRLAFFAKGTVLDRYLVTAAYDSEKDERKELFQRIPPDRYYPIYGDASVQGYEAESRKKYYAKIERDRSYLLVGDFNTYLSTNEFTRYDRSFNGVKADIDTQNATLRAFGTSTDHAANREEIQGNGTSGYYFLGRKPVIENSDKIRIEVRDRYHTERVIAFTEKTPYADYTLDYRTGALLFREPVPSYDANLNPVRIVVLYESEAPGTENHIYGARGALRTDRGSQVGVTAVVEETGRSSDTLFGADAAWKIDDKSVLRMEAAQSHTVQQGDGTAFKTELGARFRDALVDVYYRRVDRDFRNLSMTGNEIGTEKYGARVSYPLREETKIVAEAFKHSDLVYGTELGNASLGVSHRMDRFTLDTGIRYLSGDDDDGRMTTAPMVLAGVSGKISERLEGSVLQEQAFTSRTVKDYPTRTLLKLNYKLSERTSAFITDEIRESGKTSGNNAVMGISTRLYDNVIVTTSYKETAGTAPDRQIGTEVTSKWEPLKELTLTTKSGYQLQDTMTGSRGQALLGVDSSWEALRGLRVGAKAERVQLVTGRNDPAGINTAFALSAAWFGSEKIKATGRYEFRSSHDETAHLSSLGAAFMMSESLSLLGKATFWLSGKPAGNDVLFDGEAGAAYRPLGRNSLYLLGMLRFKEDSKQSTPAREERKSLTGSVEVSDRIRPDLTLHGKYAGKLSRDSLYGREVSAYTDMLLAGATYDISPRWDVDLSAKLMNQYQSGVTSVAAMPEVGYRMVKNVRIAAGYNFAKVNDRDLSGEEYGSNGPYIQLKFKFDERTIEEIYLGIAGKPRAEPVPPPAPAPVVALVQAELAAEPVQVVGSVEAIRLMVNDREAGLQYADLKLRTGSDDDVIEVKGGEPDPPLEFEVEASDPERISSWTLLVAPVSGGAVGTVSGKGAPPSPVLAELRGDNGEPFKGGEIYRYRIEVEYSDGSRVGSPSRLFGLHRTSSVAVAVNAGAFKPGSAALSRKARAMLKDAASALRKHPKEKVIVEGHADSLEEGPGLSRQRGEAAAAYLVKEERIPAERIEVRWYGSARPLASNAIAEGRDINRRVEVKGEHSDLKRPAILDRHREQPSVTVSGEPFAVDELGRFTGSVREEGECRVEMANADGRSVSTTLSLPKVTLARPAGDGAPVVCAGEDVGADGRLRTKIRYRFAGKGSPGGTLSINGETVPLAEDGAFSFTLELPQGESSYLMQSRDAQGYGREFTLKVAVRLAGQTSPTSQTGQTSPTGRTAKGNQP